ncbi:transaldolase [Synechococcus phage S-T4]|jgi:transaldolase|uniref:Transaldolase n=1 Tax=Synechococcus phage S-T4 TaxID=2268578 RepID=A0A385EHE9_9CAUD|nr:transaldolase [Synechococcus phage S-T4]AXQ70478.1 transaldolase [Synechococcus phage S-T4]
MKIFLDTADTELINQYYRTGLIDGVTTNPTLIMKSGRNPEDVYQEIKDIGIKDISMEVVGDEGQMYREGKRLYEKFGNVATIKVPCTRDGLAVCKSLSDQNIKVNVTLIFSAAQAVLAAKAGATYVSPFVGRLDDQSVAGLEVVRSISELYRIHGVKTQVLSASIRSVQRAIRSWYNGAQICTMPPKVFDQMYDHILTEKGLEIFDKDWKEVQNQI